MNEQSDNVTYESMSQVIKEVFPRAGASREPGMSCSWDTDERSRQRGADLARAQDLMTGDREPELPLPEASRSQ